jgi:leucyl/phenylalanyl-tRNA--protein transferase
MPIFRLSDELAFPHPSLAAEGGLLAVGGDVSPDRLLLAYSHGIFPWYGENRPILWWCPAPRMVLYPSELKVSRSLRKAMRRRPYRVSLDEAFEEVIDACGATPRPGQNGTWITHELRQSFVALHRRGLAHSVEAWQGARLVGGLYGLSLGTAFFGESMFAHAPDASKIAFVKLVGQLARWRFKLIDCQVPTEHVARFGAREIVLDDFLLELAEAMDGPTRRGPWSFEDEAAQ